jgi:hypothetical protein
LDLWVIALKASKEILGLRPEFKADIGTLILALSPTDSELFSRRK